jgi:hypothetical protein
MAALVVPSQQPNITTAVAADVRHKYARSQQKLCLYGAGCKNSNCMFVHPEPKTQTMCNRFLSACIRITDWTRLLITTLLEILLMLSVLQLEALKSEDSYEQILFQVVVCLIIKLVIVILFRKV